MIRYFPDSIRIAANTFILKEGKYSDAAYTILNGKVEIRMGAFGDNPQALAVLGKGDVIGEMSLSDISQIAFVS